jgi:hypothetical protein
MAWDRLKNVAGLNPSSCFDVYDLGFSVVLSFPQLDPLNLIGRSILCKAGIVQLNLIL